MHVQQFVMAYGVEQDRLRALLPEGFRPLRPVLRINAEIRDGKTAWVEFNTAVESEGKRGWLNVGHWDDAAFTVDGKTTRFETGLLTISFTGVGIRAAARRRRTTTAASSWVRKKRCGRPRPSPAAKSSVTANSPGISTAAHTASASERRCPPFPLSRKITTPGRRSPWRTRRSSPVSRFWAPIRWLLSGKCTDNACLCTN